MPLSARAAVLGTLQVALAGLFAQEGELSVALALLVLGILCLGVALRPLRAHLVVLLASIPLGFLAFVGPVLILFGNKGSLEAPPQVWGGWAFSLVGFGMAAWLHHDMPRK